MTLPWLFPESSLNAAYSAVSKIKSAEESSIQWMMLVREEACKIACKMITFHNILENNLSYIDLFPYFFIPTMSANMKCSLSRSLISLLKTCYIDLKPQNWNWSYFNSVPFLMTIYGLMFKCKTCCSISITGICGPVMEGLH